MSLDIETGIETFDITVLISRLVLRLKTQGGIPVIETLARLHAHLWYTTYITLVDHSEIIALGFKSIQNKVSPFGRMFFYQLQLGLGLEIQL